MIPVITGQSVSSEMGPIPAMPDKGVAGTAKSGQSFQDYLNKLDGKASERTVMSSENQSDKKSETTKQESPEKKPRLKDRRNPEEEKQTVGDTEHKAKKSKPKTEQSAKGAEAEKHGKKELSLSSEQESSPETAISLKDPEESEQPKAEKLHAGLEAEKQIVSGKQQGEENAPPAELIPSKSEKGEEKTPERRKESKTLPLEPTEAEESPKSKEKGGHTVIDLRRRKGENREAGSDQSQEKKHSLKTEAGKELHGQNQRLSSAAEQLNSSSDGGEKSTSNTASDTGQNTVKVIHVDAAPEIRSADAGAKQSIEQAARQLSSRFQQDVSDKIVKQSSIIVKSETSGEMKLILHPEKLGRVHIRIQMEDNRIAGKIFVDNTNVRDLFEGNMKQLEKAFQQEGFDQAKLDVFVGGRESGSRRRRQNPSFQSRKRDERIALETLERSVPATERGRDETIINLVV